MALNYGGKGFPTMVSADRHSTAPDARTAPEPQTILVVDDEQINLKNYTAILERAGFRVIAFPAAADALSSLRQGAHADVIVTDYRMPAMDGLSFLEILRREQSSVPVIMLTAHGDIDTYFKSFSLGLFEYINKPFRDAELVRIVQAALGEAVGMRRRRTSKT
jgi:DNA-binding NtrC family response regulator